MRIPLPDDVKEIIEKHKVKGDYVTISDRLCGSKEKAVDVANAVRLGYGDVDLVKEIASFYREKKQVIDQLNPEPTEEHATAGQ